MCNPVQLAFRALAILDNGFNIQKNCSPTNKSDQVLAYLWFFLIAYSMSKELCTGHKLMLLSLVLMTLSDTSAK